jgi:energy-coupling factor transporter ATP-binding protein EcfA2
VLSKASKVLTEMVPGSLVVLTGASGSGKTAIALELERTHPEYTVLRFDTIGVPSAEVMATFCTGHQPGGAWQRAMTLQWFERIAPILRTGRSVLFEGQMRIAFITEALAINGITHAHIILVECDDCTRDDRLVLYRKQPELANESMRGWSRYLHNEALKSGVEVLDTGSSTLSDSVSRIVGHLKS